MSYTKINLSSEQLSSYIDNCLTIYQVAEIVKCSLPTIRKYIKKYKLQVNKGFYSTGKKVGRPIGIPVSKEECLARSQRSVGNLNPFYGKKHTITTKKLMSKNHADFTRCNNPFSKSLSNPIKRIAHKNRVQAIWDSRDTKYRNEFSKKLSYSMSKSRKFEDSNFHKNHLSGFYTSSKCDRVFYRSSWELLVCKILNSSNLVTSFSLEEIVIPYIVNGETRFSRPDFIINLSSGNRLMIEVKPEALRSIGLNAYKILGYEKYCSKNNMGFFLVGKAEIINIELITNLLIEVNNGKPI